MSRIFISGSSTGLGLMAGELLASQGHHVVLHARNANRAEDTRRALPRAEAVVVGDIETIAGAKDIAIQVNALGAFDAVIHNAAVGYRRPSRHRGRSTPRVRDQYAVGLYPDGLDRAAETARLLELGHASSC
jgi:NAD(P)-dependent dehydrogenase (short-subunit alcohol dehydrogenase family)